jgi:hypothetical protein
MATYYIDYVGASDDSANGTSTSTPWKRCPGDSRFSGTYTQDAVNGDTFIFKGGVQYSTAGTSGINLSYAGASNSKRMIYDGDSGTYATRWGSGLDKGIIDGGGTARGFLVKSNKGYITINSLEIRNGIETDQYEALINGDQVSGADYFNISNNTIHDAGVPIVGTHPYGTGISSSSDYWNIYNNYLYDCYYRAIFSYNGSNWDIYNNIIEDKVGWGVNLVPTSGTMTNMKVHDNVFKDVSVYYATTEVHVDVIWIFGSSSIDGLYIYNNLFYMTTDLTALDLWIASAVISLQASEGSGYTWSNIYIYNNVICNFASPGIGVSSWKAPIDHLYIYNNSMWADWQGSQNVVGIRIVAHSGYGGFNYVYIKGNTMKFTGGTSGTIELGLTSLLSNVDIDYNNYYSGNSTPFTLNDGNQDTNWTSWKAAGHDANGKGSTSDPLYVNAGELTHDCSLQVTSPCKDAFPTASAPTTIFTTDINGNTRPAGSAWDIGAYEYGPIRTLFRP